MKLYNRIYKAINEGIQKALLTDNTDDVSINYAYHKMDNSLDLWPVYIDNLLNHKLTDDNDIDILLSNTGARPAYNDIKAYYKNSHTQYRPKNIYEINQIYQKIANIGNMSMDKLDISWMNMSGIISVILKNGVEIPFDKYNKNEHRGACLIKLYFSSDFSIIFHKNFYLTPDLYQWHDGNHKSLFNNMDCVRDIQKNGPDHKGWQHTYENINIPDNDFANYPAFQYVDSLNICTGYKAYIPAVHEIILINIFYKLIQYLSYKINGSYTNYQRGLMDYYWTSTEYDRDEAYKYNGNSPCQFSKQDECMVLPFFKKN